MEVEIGDAVVMSNGRIGRLDRLYRIEDTDEGDRALIQLGADGPYKVVRPRTLRLATEKEVTEAGMYGVGFNIKL